MRLQVACLLIAGFTVAHAGEFGMVGEFDLNGDGIIDRIQSGPRELFGQSGGPFVVTLGENGTLPEKSYLIHGNGRFVIETGNDNGPTRLWSYGRISCCEGILASYVFTSDGMEQQQITINPGDGGSDVGRANYRSIFSEENLLPLKRISPYSPPPNPSGRDWGEG